MTATLSDQDTDTARQILEQAELAPPCEHPRGCDRTAEWIATCIGHFCEHTTRQLVCTPCLEAARRAQDDPTIRLWHCPACEKVYGPCAKAATQTLHVEPLR